MPPSSKRTSENSEFSVVADPRTSPLPTSSSRPCPGAIIYEDTAHPIRDHHISAPAWAVLQRLRAAGHETFIVGGTVRDILLRRTPKDYDVLTSAGSRQIAALFPRAFVIGRSFPICHVHHGGDVIEVSSFSTGVEPGSVPPDAAARLTDHGKSSIVQRSRSRARGERRKKTQSIAGAGFENASSTSASQQTISEESVGSSSWQGSAQWIEDDDDAKTAPTWASARQDNASKRDFTVNGLLYDPFSRTLYDYVGGIQDCDSRTLRALGNPEESFVQDPARVLRGIRLMARIELVLDGPTANAMTSAHSLVAGINHGRLQMELAAMMAHGAACESLKLLYKFRFLEYLLPHHAVHLWKEKIPRGEPPAIPSFLKSANLHKKSPEKKGHGDVDANGPDPLLFHLIALMDAKIQAHKPVESSVWVTLLVAPLVAAECRLVARRRSAEARRQKVKKKKEQMADEQIAVGESGLERITTDTAAIGALPMSEENTEADVEESPSPPRVRGAPTAKYLEAYNQVISTVIHRLLSAPVDRKTQRVLAAMACKTSECGAHADCEKENGLASIETTPASPKGMGMEGLGEGRGDTEYVDEESLVSTRASDVAVASHRDRHGLSNVTVTLPTCLLPRQALEAAAEILRLEAVLRGESLPEVVGRNRREKRRQLGGSSSGHRRITQNENFVLQILRRRDVGWWELTEL